MNWYKRIKFADITDIENAPFYVEIGHGYGGGRGYPNYMWVFYDGELLTEEDTDAAGSHSYVWQQIPDEDWDRIYYGRFESETGRLSLTRPIEGAGRFREPPDFLIRMLYQTFPILSIHEY